MDPATRRKRMIDAFRNEFNDEPRVGARAPGRVDLMGSHTDYNEGSVITLPIDRDTWILAAPHSEPQITLQSVNVQSTCTFAVNNSDARPIEGWGRYVQAVAITLANAGFSTPGFHGVVDGTIPISSGLSSSASLESAVATLFEQLGGYTIDKLQKAKFCQQAENEWVGVKCGILDQYSSILGEKGKALVLDCRELTHQTVTIPPDLQPVICNTCAPRELSGSEYSQRREQCESGAAYFGRLDPAMKTLRDVPLAVFAEHESRLPDDVRFRSRFIIEENLRVFELRNALENDDRAAINRIMKASYIGARDLFEISVPAMQSMFNAMSTAPGSVGCRQAGAGFGGCMVSLVESSRVAEFVECIKTTYASETGIAPEVYPVQTASGAGTLEI